MNIRYPIYEGVYRILTPIFAPHIMVIHGKTHYYIQHICVFVPTDQ